jgi:DNA-3-methyladenine glycosylase
MAQRLQQAFYSRPAATVAPALLGKILIRRQDTVDIRGRIVETEAYCGESDPGSHAFRGPSPRTQVMFGPAGHLYVYFTYGMHFCANVVTDEEGTAGAVLLRALQPLEGLNVMEERRGPRATVDLCNGPAKLCQAFGIARAQNGASLLHGDIWIEDDGVPPGRVETSTRVGLSAGRGEELRFYLADSPFVSRGKPSLP